MHRTLALVALLLVACQHGHHGESDKGHRAATMGRDPEPITTTTAAAVAPLPPEDTTVHRVPVGNSPSIGGKSPLVTIVEFSDFECRFCKRVEPTLAALRVRYGDDLAIVWKDDPLKNHAHAKAAADLALDARAERGVATFWAVHDDLYAASSLDDASLARIAKEHHVVPTKKHHATIDDDTSLASSLGVHGTPTFFINGRKLVGARNEAAFSAIIDPELAAAKALVAKGTPRKKVYETIMATAQ